MTSGMHPQSLNHVRSRKHCFRGNRVRQKSAATSRIANKKFFWKLFISPTPVQHRKWSPSIFLELAEIAVQIWRSFAAPILHNSLHHTATSLTKVGILPTKQAKCWRQEKTKVVTTGWYSAATWLSAAFISHGFIQPVCLCWVNTHYAPPPGRAVLLLRTSSGNLRRCLLQTALLLRQHLLEQHSIPTDRTNTQSAAPDRRGATDNNMLLDEYGQTKLLSLLNVSTSSTRQSISTTIYLQLNWAKQPT